jgi:spore coat polysaccharide biosynthesis predicted glycosyltransferase SpsG
VPWLVVDSYRASYDTLSQWAAYAQQVLFFDDDQRLAYPAGQWVLNYSPAAHPSHYIGAARVLAGLEYAPLRPEFWQPLPRKQFPYTVGSVLLTLGGMPNPDLFNLLLAALRHAIPRCHVHLVRGNTPDEALAPRPGQRVTLHSHLTATQMQGLMQECELALTAGGTTVLELCTTQTPSVCIATAENQLPTLTHLAQHDAIALLPPPQPPDYISRVIGALTATQSLTRRRKLAHNMARYGPDGQGAHRVAAQLLAHLPVA